MLDHIGFSVSDYARAKAFYIKAIAPLGYGLIMEVEQETEKGFPAAGFGADGKPNFWLGGEGGLNKAIHVALLADKRCRCILKGSDRRAAEKTTARWGCACRPSVLLRSVRLRSQRAQHRSGVSQTGMSVCTKSAFTRARCETRIVKRKKSCARHACEQVFA